MDEEAVRPAASERTFFDWDLLDMQEGEASGDSKEVFGLFMSEEHLLATGAFEPVWARLTSVVDSGAAESVIPESMVDWIPLEAGESFQRGTTYTSASGQVIPNLGSRTVKGMTNEMLEVSAVYQVCAVTKPLSSVARMCSAGNRVVFEDDGGYIEHIATGAVTPVRKENGVYVWDLWIEAPANKVQGFARQSR